MTRIIRIYFDIVSGGADRLVALLVAVVLLGAVHSSALQRDSIERELTREIACRDSLSAGVYGLDYFVRDGSLIEGRRLDLLAREPGDTVTAVFMTFRGKAPRYMIYTPADTIDFYSGEVDIDDEMFVPLDFRKGLPQALAQYGIMDEIGRWNESDYILPLGFDPKWKTYANLDAIDLYMLVVRVFDGADGAADREAIEMFVQYSPLVQLPYGGPYIIKLK